MKKFFAAIFILLIISIISFAKDCDDKIKIYSVFKLEDRIIVQSEGDRIYEYKNKCFNPLEIECNKKNFAFIFKDEVYCFDENEKEFRQADKNKRISFLNKQSIFSGECYLRNFRIYNDELYFACEYEGINRGKILRYNFANNELKFVDVENIGEYYFDKNGKCILLTKKADESVFNEVDFEKNELKPVFKLKGEISCPIEISQKIFAIDKKKGIVLELDENGKQLKKYEDYNVFDALVGANVDGKYCVFGYNGVYFPNFEENKKATTLKLCGISIWETERQFMKEHPNVRFEEVSADTCYKNDISFSEAYASGIIDFDVAIIGYGANDVKKLFDKGFFYDMSLNDDLRSKANKLYEPIKNAVFYGEKLACFPQRFRGEQMLFFDEPSLKKFDLTEDTIPDTIEKLLDFAIEKQTQYEKTGEGKIVWLSDRPLWDMFYYVHEAYIDNYRRNGKPLDFDTEEYRRLMEKVFKLAKITPAQSYEEVDRLMRLGGSVDDLNFNDFILKKINVEKDEKPKYKFNLYAYIINPKSKNKELALEYVNFCVNRYNEKTKLFLYDEKCEPIMNPEFLERVEKLEAEKKLLEKAVLNEKRPKMKEELSQKIEEIESWINNLGDLKYIATRKEIDYYQNEFIKNAEVIKLHETIHQNSVLEKYIKNFLNEKVPLNQFIEYINNREKLKRLENGK